MPPFHNILIESCSGGLHQVAPIVAEKGMEPKNRPCYRDWKRTLPETPSPKHPFGGFVSSIERTAYPQLSDPVTPTELQRDFTPTDEEKLFAVNSARKASHRLGILVLLKVFGSSSGLVQRSLRPPRAESVSEAARIQLDRTFAASPLSTD
jgi:hypothetical protein